MRSETEVIEAVTKWPVKLAVAFALRGPAFIPPRARRLPLQLVVWLTGAALSAVSFARETISPR